MIVKFPRKGVCDSPGLADTGDMYFPNQHTHLFPLGSLWRLNAARNSPVLAPAITLGSFVFDAFLGFWSREKATLSHRSDAKTQ